MPKGIFERTEETRNNMSKAKMGNTNALGHKCTEETKQKDREAHLGEKAYNWKGGFKKTDKGYILYLLPEGCKFSHIKKNNGYILLHRLIMAEYLQRPLKDEEVVHHINGNINDNRIENLKLIKNKSEHMTLHQELRKERM